MCLEGSLIIYHSFSKIIVPAMGSLSDLQYQTYISSFVVGLKSHQKAVNHPCNICANIGPISVYYQATHRVHSLWYYERWPARGKRPGQYLCNSTCPMNKVFGVQKQHSQHQGLVTIKSSGDSLHFQVFSRITWGSIPSLALGCLFDNPWLLGKTFSPCAE